MSLCMYTLYVIYLSAPIYYHEFSPKNIYTQFIHICIFIINTSLKGLQWSTYFSADSDDSQEQSIPTLTKIHFLMFSTQCCTPPPKMNFRPHCTAVFKQRACMPCPLDFVDEVKHHSVAYLSSKFF